MVRRDDEQRCATQSLEVRDGFIRGALCERDLPGEQERIRLRVRPAGLVERLVRLGQTPGGDQGGAGAKAPPFGLLSSAKRRSPGSGLGVNT